jgi:hypothetical protein
MFYVLIACGIAPDSNNGSNCSQGIHCARAYKDVKELVLLNMAGRIDLFYNLFGLTVGLAYQVFAGMYKAQQKFVEIKSEHLHMKE